MQVPGSTILVRPSDCFDRWHQVTCREFSLTECHHSADERFRGSISVRNFGSLTINDVWASIPGSDHMRVTRSATDVRKDPRDYFMFWLTMGGEAVLSQNGRAAHVRRGDLVLHDQSQPFTIDFAEQSRAIVVSIPRPLLTSRLPDAHRLTAQPISYQSRVGGLAGSFIRQLARLEVHTEDTAMRLGTSALDVFATTIQTELGSDGPRRGRERLARIKKYILANLHDTGLDLDRIAAAHNMAPRTLNRLFAGEGTTPIRWLWQQRLAGSYKALAEGRFSQVTEAALSFGFSDVSHFSRAFKAAFGRSPHDVKG